MEAILMFAFFGALIGIGISAIVNHDADAYDREYRRICREYPDPSEITRLAKQYDARHRHNE